MKLYTVAEVAAETGLSEKAVRRRIEKGTVISANRGNRRLIPESELERLLEEVGAGGSPRAAFPSDGGTSGQGNTEGDIGGNSLELVMRELTDTRQHVERLAREAEREKLQREQAEARALSEQEAREAAQAEALELRARVRTLEEALETWQPVELSGEAARVTDDEASAELDVMLDRVAEIAARNGSDVDGGPEVLELIEEAAPVPAENSSRLLRFLRIG